MKKRLLSLFMSVLMIFSVFSLPVSSDDANSGTDRTLVQTSTSTNTMDNGLFMAKTTNIYDDNTAQIVISAFTNGEVHQTSTITPTDIVLVLDLSGSMDDSFDTTTVTDHVEIFAEKVTTWVGFFDSVDTWRIRNENQTLYIDLHDIDPTIAENTYHVVHAAGIDSNNRRYYSYSSNNEQHYVYPIIDSDESDAPDREFNNYPEVQFYAVETTRTTTSRMKALQNGVNFLLGEIAADNAGVSSVNQHRVSIVKFADDNFCYQNNNDEWVSTNDVSLAEVGDAKDRNGYNYTQEVVGFTAVTSDNLNSLKSIVDALEPAGATSIDYGMELAEHIIETKTAPAAVDGVTALQRQNVVIVFSDGVPTHSSDYDASVAASAVAYAGDIKDMGAKVYTVSVYPGTDGTVLVPENAGTGSDLARANAFMHYLSSNYPNADGSGNTITPGEGSPETGYYKTPDEATSLALIFDAILGEVDHPTIELGTEASIVDKISPVFELNGDGSIEAITVQKVDHRGVEEDGNWIIHETYGEWLSADENGVTDLGTDSVTYDANDQLLTVKGFDFDKYYVSKTPRTNPDDSSDTAYHGSKIVITIELKLKDEILDAAVDSVNVGSETPSTDMIGYEKDANGNETYTVKSNIDAAVVFDSDGDTVGETPTPELELVPVKYYVQNGFDSGNDVPTYALTKTVYRFAGTAYTAIDKPADTLEYTHTDWHESGKSVPNDRTFTVGETGLNLYSERTAVAYQVSYLITGQQIAGVTAPDTDTDVAYSSSYKVKDVTYNGAALKAGGTITVGEITYTFTGWDIADTVEVESLDSSYYFEMPANNVELHGTFVQNTAMYKIEHYLMDTEGNYPESPSATHTHYATIGAEVSALDNNGNPPHHAGFEYASNYTGNITVGEVKEDGSLVLKLYYARNTYKVTYQYTGTVPDNAAELPDEQKYYHGATVTVAAPAGNIQNYTFNGWYRDGASISGTFVMPAEDVVIYGSYELITSDVTWTVEHYYADLAGNYTQDSNFVRTTHTDTVNSQVTATPINKTGFTFDAESTVNNYPANSGETTSLTGVVMCDDPNTEDKEALVIKLYYTRNSYNVTYGYSSSTQYSGETLPESHSVKYGATVTVAELLTNNDYTFNGWNTTDVHVGGALETYTGNAGDAFADTFIMPANDVQLLGWFENVPVSYTVNHIRMYGENEIARESQTYTNVNASESAVAYWRTYTGFQPDLNKTNYVLNNNDPVVIYTDEDTKTEISENIVSVDYLANGNTLVINLYYYAYPVFNVEYEISGLPSDSEVKAPEDQNPHANGESVTVEAHTPVAGYDFSGWDIVETETTEELGISDDNNTFTNSTFTMPAHDVKLVGVYTPKESSYKIVYWTQTADTNGTCVNEKYYVKYSETDYIPAKVDAIVTGHLIEGGIEGYGFAENNNGISTSGRVAADGSLVINMYYDAHVYKVTYVLTGEVPDGVVVPVVNTHMFGETVKVAGNLSAANYDFSGWKTDDAVINDGSFTMPNNDVIIVGHFSVDKFTVTYVVDGYIPAGYVVPEISSYKPGTTVAIEEAPAEIEGYTFSGWTVETPDGLAVDAYGNFTMPSENVVIKGTFTSLGAYTVTYIVNEKIYGEVETYYEGDTVSIREKPEDESFIFDGWYSRDVDVRGTTFTMPAQNVVIYGYINEIPKIDIPIIDEGKIELTKVLSAPEGFPSGRTFTFQIWNADGYEDDIFEEVELEAGESVTIKAPIGNYYIIEVDAEEEGYNVTTSCSANRNKIRVVGGRTTSVSFKNVYTSAVALETDDHFGYIIGYPDGTVKPENTITRAEVATIFFRLLTDESRDEYWSQENSYSDVSSDDWFNNAISTLSNAGILTGYGDGTFRPNEPITRAELVKIAVSFYSSDVVADAAFSDTNGHWADIYIDAAYALEFISGYEDGSFKPDQDIKRAEAFKIINRSLMRAPHEDHLLDDMIKWSDNVEGKWYYAEVQEATNSHSYDWHDYHEVWTKILPVRDWAALENEWSDAYSGN